MTWFSSKNFRINIKDKSCGLYFYPLSSQFSLILSLHRTTERDGQLVKNDLDDLLKVVSAVLKDDRQEWTSGSWKLVKDSLAGVNFIEFRGTQIFIPIDDLNELLHLVSQLPATICAEEGGQN